MSYNEIDLSFLSNEVTSTSTHDILLPGPAIDSNDIYRCFQRFWHVPTADAAFSDAGKDIRDPVLIDEKPGLGIGLNVAFNLLQVDATLFCASNV